MLTKDDLKAIDNLLDKKFDKRLEPINKKLNRIQKTLDRTIKFFDGEVLGIKKKIDKIESNLELKQL
jgi:hypothetical protein